MGRMVNVYGEQFYRKVKAYGERKVNVYGE